MLGNDKINLNTKKERDKKEWANDLDIIETGSSSRATPKGFIPSRAFGANTDKEVSAIFARPPIKEPWPPEEDDYSVSPKPCSPRPSTPEEIIPLSSVPLGSESVDTANTSVPFMSMLTSAGRGSPEPEAESDKKPNDSEEKSESKKDGLNELYREYQETMAKNPYIIPPFGV